MVARRNATELVDSALRDCAQSILVEGSSWSMLHVCALITNCFHHLVVARLRCAAAVGGCLVDVELYLSPLPFCWLEFVMLSFNAPGSVIRENYSHALCVSGMRNLGKYYHYQNSELNRMRA